MKELKGYLDEFGRPRRIELTELGSGQSVSVSSYNALWEEYVKLQTLLDELLNEQIQKLEQIRQEVAQAKLHLASISQEPIDEKDAEEE